MDISDTLDPKSEQLDAVELIGGPRIFTIEGVSRGSDEQPVNIALKDFPRLWRPGKSMRRVLVACWGPDASQYVGRRVELFCDPDVKFGGVATGGTRISRLSNIPKRKTVPLLIARGKSAVFTVDPLPELSPTEAHLESLRAEWNRADPARRKTIESEVAMITGEQPELPVTS